MAKYKKYDDLKNKPECRRGIMPRFYNGHFGTNCERDGIECEDCIKEYDKKRGVGEEDLEDEE